MCHSEYHIGMENTMTRTLTVEQIRAVAEHPNEPIRLTDPFTNKIYVLMSEEVFEKVKHALAQELQTSDAYAAIDRAFAPGWDDPKMDDYDRYDELKQ